MFLASVPIWWAFEATNQFTQNWHYLGAGHYSVLMHAVLASWHFSTVIPAVFETAELVGSFGFINRFRRGPVVPVSRGHLMGAMVLGLLFIVALVLWPHQAFAGTWLYLFLLLDPLNYFWGRPSILGSLGRGDWRIVVALGVGALVCGWFWEMWNYWAFPKWEYAIPLVDFGRVFEMPVLGYGGYLPFGLEVYAVYHFLSGFVGKVRKDYIRIVDSRWVKRPSQEAAESPV